MRSPSAHLSRAVAAAVAVWAAAPLRAQGAPAAPATAAATRPAVPLSGPDRWADSAARAIDVAAARGDRAGLAAARVLVTRALVVTPNDPLLLHYLGYAFYREATTVMGAGDEKGARPFLTGADTALARSAQLRPMAETSALRAAVFGMQIATGGALAGMRLGPKAGAAMDEARRLGPANPRVALLQGISDFNTPAMWGGGADKARRSLERAVALYADDRPTPPLPAWGRAEAHLWLGRTLQRAGDTAAARREYARAQTLQPDNAWLTRVLIPSLDRGAGR